MSKILFTGDWHAGLVSWGIDRSSELDNSFDRLTQEAESHNIDFTVVMGDLTESFRYPGNKTFKQISYVLNRLVDIAKTSKTKVYILKGNHDWTGLEVYETFKKDDICYIEEPTIIEAETPIIAIPYRKYYQLPEGGYGELIQNIMDTDGRGSYILSAHAGAEGSLVGEPTIPLSILNDSRISKAFLGHIHMHTRIKNAKNAYYTGALIRNTFGESGSKTGAWILDTHADCVSDIEIASFPLATLQYDNIGGAISDGTLEEEVRKNLTQNPRTMFRLIAPKSSYRTEDISELGQKLCKEYGVESHNTYPFVAFDSPAVKKRFEERTEKKHSVAMIYEQISVRDLWRAWCEEKGKKDVSAIGDALLNGASAAEVWDRLKRCSASHNTSRNISSVNVQPTGVHSAPTAPKKEVIYKPQARKTENKQQKSLSELFNEIGPVELY